MGDIRDALLSEPMIGASCNTKDYHCEAETIAPDVAAVIKPGIAVSIDGGKITAFNGSSYHAIVTNDVRAYGAGYYDDDISRSFSKKGVRVVITNDNMVAGDLILLKADGTFLKGAATDSATAVGKAVSSSWSTTDSSGSSVKVVKMAFNWDFIKDISGDTGGGSTGGESTSEENPENSESPVESKSRKK